MTQTTQVTHEKNSGGEVHVLWHARHLAMEENGLIIHRDPDGGLHSDEEEWRIIGIYAAEADAETQKESTKNLPGFRDESGCFEISSLTLDEDLWAEGFFTAYPDGREEN